METRLPQDFREFLALLNSEKIEYLVVGGYAVSFHGYARPTGDLDVWVAIKPDTARRLLTVLARFGFGSAGATAELFLTPGRIVRLGVPPVRIEVMNSISGVDFAECFAQRVSADLDGVAVNLISRADLLRNKRAAGRPKDLNDVQHLEPGRPSA